MGSLVSLFRGDEGEDIFIDFEDPAPSDEEESILSATIGEVLKEGTEALNMLVEYRGCGNQIKQAISAPSAETEKEAWVALVPSIAILKEVYDFSLKLKETFPTLLHGLMKEEEGSSLTTKQLLAKQLANIFDFVLQFDETKMRNPAIQNDFSYYRRYLSRLKNSKESLGEIVVKDDLANKMSLFFADAAPMMKLLTDTTVHYLDNEGANDNVTKNSVTTVLSLLANACADMVAKKRYASNETNMFCLRTMTGCIILVDHVHQLGAFHKKSLIKIKNCITTLRGYGDGQATQGLLSALTYSTLHLNDPETPSSIKQLLH